MEMVLRLRIPSFVAVPWKRIARAGLILVLSWLLYCCVREYAADFQRGMDEAATCRLGTQRNSGIEMKAVYENMNETAIGLCRREMKNITGQEIEDYLHSAGIAGRAEPPKKAEAAVSEDMAWNLWNSGPAESERDLWNPKAADPTENFDIPFIETDRVLDVPLIETDQGSVAPSISEDKETDVPFIEEETSTSENGEPREIAGFLVDSQGYITGTTDKLVLMDGILAIASKPECVGVRAGAFSDIGEEVMEIYIPANICDIEQGAFDNFAALMYIEVSEENLNYYSEDGILFSMDGEEIAYPAGR